MSVNREISDLIPLLVQGRLDKEEGENLLAQIRQSGELQKELEFWEGIYSIRKEMPRFDCLSHPLPEVLDRFAQGRINQLSAEYSELTSHLPQCAACTEDVELLRQAVKHLPEEHVSLALQERKGFLYSLFSLPMRTGGVLATVTSVLVVVFGLYLVLHRNANQGDQNSTLTILLQSQFEKRNTSDQNNIQEMPVSLYQNTNKIIFSFATDRIEIPNYHYSINLIPRSGKPLTLAESKIECRETELTKQCQLTVTESEALKELKQGGSFSLSIKEEFPAGVTLEPAQYEYYFKVSVKD